MEQLGHAATIGVEDLKVAEPRRPLGAPATLALDCRRRLIPRTPVLALEPDRLLLHHPALLAEPLVVERNAVAVGAIDTRFREGGETLRFPYSHEFDWTPSCPGDTAETYGWLYVRGARSKLPFVSDVRDLPNIVFLFHERLALPWRRRTRRRESGRPVPGFFARASDPAAARAALRDWGVTRPLTVADAELAEA